MSRTALQMINQNDDFCNQIVFVSYLDATSFEDVSPQAISDDSSTGSKIHGKICLFLKESRTVGLLWE